jgi:hypothetical protein
MRIVNVSYRLAAPRIFTLSKLYPARACDSTKTLHTENRAEPRFVFHFAKNLIQVARC